MTFEQNIAELNSASNNLTQKVLETGALAHASAHAAKDDASRARDERVQLENVLTHTKAARDNAVASSAAVSATSVGDEDYIVPAATTLLSGYSDVVATAVSDGVWAANAHRWGAPQRVLAVAHDYREVYSGRSEYTKISLLDLTKPSLPVWLVLERGKHFWNAGKGISLVLSGSLLILGVRSHRDDYSGNGLLIYDFATDDLCISTLGPGAMSIGRMHGWRNHPEPIKSCDEARPFPLVSYSVNQVATKMAADAPANPISGLPMPTIAVATDGGVSILHPAHEGWKTANLTGFKQPVRTVEFLSGGGIACNGDYNAHLDIYDPLPEEDTTSSEVDRSYAENTVIRTGDGGTSIRNCVSGSGAHLLVDTNEPYLLSICENPIAAHNGMIARIDQKYATPYMVGDIQFAGLCDGDEGVKTGGDVVPITTTTSGWDIIEDGVSALGAPSVAAVTLVNGDSVAFANNSGDYRAMRFIIPGRKAGELLQFKYELVRSAGSGLVELRAAMGDASLHQVNVLRVYQTTPGKPEITSFKVPEDGDVALCVIVSGDGTGARFKLHDSVHVALEDRSGRGNHARLQGALNLSKTVGSDIAEAKGFNSASNLIVDTGKHLTANGQDFSFTAMVRRKAGLTSYLFDGRTVDGDGDNDWAIIHGDGKLNIFGAQSETGAFPIGSAQAVTVIRRASRETEFWCNGRLLLRKGPRDVESTGNTALRIGARYSNNEPVLALRDVTVSKSIPSPEQIKDIHRDLHDRLTNTTVLTGDIRSLAYDTLRDVYWVATRDSKLRHMARRGTTFAKTIDLTNSELGDITTLAVNDGHVIVGGTAGVWISQPELNLRKNTAPAPRAKCAFELGEGDAVQRDFWLPSGWKPTSVSVGGRRTRKGADATWVPLFDGYKHGVRFNAAPGTVDIACDAISTS